MRDGIVQEHRREARPRLSQSSRQEYAQHKDLLLRVANKVCRLDMDILLVPPLDADLRFPVLRFQFHTAKPINRSKPLLNACNHWPVGIDVPFDGPLTLPLQEPFSRCEYGNPILDTAQIVFTAGDIQLQCLDPVPLLC